MQQIIMGTSSFVMMQMLDHSQGARHTETNGGERVYCIPMTQMHLSVKGGMMEGGMEKACPIPAIDKSIPPVQV